MTAVVYAIQKDYKISTHTLTWSVTFAMNSIGYGYGNFNSHAHVERDRCVADKHPIIKISTHTLTWSVTCGNRHKLGGIKFQLTRSRGA